jgi:hypothetical protein
MRYRTFVKEAVVSSETRAAKKLQTTSSKQEQQPPSSLVDRWMRKDVDVVVCV